MNTVATGIDVSKWDAQPVNWALADLAFLYAKISEGLIEDTLFRRHWETARGHTLRGAYHYFRPSIDPKKAARKMVEILGNDLGELPPALDLETTDKRADTLERAREWCAEVQQLTGKRPIIYSGIPFLTEIGAFQKAKGAYKHAWLMGADFWFAAYPYDNMAEAKREKLLTDIMTGVVELPTMPKVDLCPPLHLQIWQWTSRVKPELIRGYYLGRDGKKAVDVNYARLEWLEQFSISKPVEGNPHIVQIVGLQEYALSLGGSLEDIKALETTAAGDMNKFYIAMMQYTINLDRKLQGE